MKALKYLMFLVIGVFIALQFLPRELNQNKVMSPNDIAKVMLVPSNVQLILRTSCYDCHSNKTNYPWYSKIQPIRFMLDSDIKEGKENLNFSEFGSYSKRKQKNKLKAIANNIAEDEMPLRSYTLIHQNAKLNQTQKSVIENWVADLQDGLAPTY